MTTQPDPTPQTEENMTDTIPDHSAGDQAAERIGAYLAARRILRDHGAQLADQIAEAKNGGQPWARLTATDLLTHFESRERLRILLLDAEETIERLKQQLATARPT